MVTLLFSSIVSVVLCHFKIEIVLSVVTSKWKKKHWVSVVSLCLCNHFHFFYFNNFQKGANYRKLHSFHCWCLFGEDCTKPHYFLKSIVLIDWYSTNQTLILPFAESEEFELFLQNSLHQIYLQLTNCVYHLYLHQFQMSSCRLREKAVRQHASINHASRKL